MAIKYSSTNYFESETSRSLKLAEKALKQFMWFRVPDTKTLQFGSGSDKIIAPKVPCDYISLYKGRAYFLECKSLKSNATSYSFRYIRPHQLDYLQKAEKCGGKGYFLICNRYHRNDIEAFAVHPWEIQRWMNEGKKSITWERLRRCINLKPTHNEKGYACWDLKALFNKHTVFRC